ncbi:MAG: IclR family transcriptional regulator [Sulfitobacter sp.]
MDKAVVKAFTLLEILSENEAPMGVTELSNRTELGKSNVHRLLQTLLTLGYVKKPDETHYTASLRVWELGSQIISRVNIRDVARPYMQLLAQATGETVHLSELCTSEVLYIDKIESREPVRAYTQLGGRAPAYCTATGKVMLAYQTDDDIRQVLKTAIQHTTKTLIDADVFLAQAEQIRQQRFAVNRGEWRSDIIGISAPVCCAMGQVDGAIGLSAPASRLSESQLEGLAPMILEFAEKISIELGCTPSVWSGLNQPRL